MNGYPKEQATFARVSGYVEQFDVHSPQTTVREALLFSAQLRTRGETTEVITAFVDEVMDLVELHSLRDGLVSASALLCMWPKMCHQPAWSGWCLCPLVHVAQHESSACLAWLVPLPSCACGRRCVISVHALSTFGFFSSAESQRYACPKLSAKLRLIHHTSSMQLMRHVFPTQEVRIQGITACARSVLTDYALVAAVNIHLLQTQDT